MKIIYKISDALTFEVDGADQKEIFEKLASVGEVFGESNCGQCGKTNIRFRVREIEGNKYYELKCADCGAILAFGAHKKGGTLFPKRKDNEGNYIKNKGWTKWDGTNRT